MACAVWCLCQTLRDLMLQPYLFIQNADCCKKCKEALWSCGLSRWGKTKFSQMFYDVKSGKATTQWNVKRFYLAASDMYRLSLDCAMLVKMKSKTTFLEKSKEIYIITNIFLHLWVLLSADFHGHYHLIYLNAWALSKVIRATFISHTQNVK